MSKHGRDRRSSATVAKLAHVSEWKLRRIREIAKKKPEALVAVRAGEKTVQKVLREIRKEEREARRVVPAGAVLPENCTLLHAGRSGGQAIPRKNIQKRLGHAGDKTMRVLARGLVVFLGMA